MPAPYPLQPIPIEALSEYDVREISLDGQEMLEKPLTPAENFQRIVNRIDFSKTYEDDEDDACDSQEIDNQHADNLPPRLWKEMLETMRVTLTEINALVDILAVIKEGKYIAINPVATESLSPNLSLFLAGKKRALAAASDMLLKGTDRLRCRHTEMVDARIRVSSTVSGGSSQTEMVSNSFHKALMHLRQEWRLKLHQNAILGDVSLRSIGSRFRESGNFEVRECDVFAQNRNESGIMDAVTGVEVVFSRSLEALLNCCPDSDILRVRFYQSPIEAGPASLWKSVFGSDRDILVTSSTAKDKTLSNLNQRQRLFRAQRILSCKEILFLLSCDACNSRSHDSVLSDTSAFAMQDEIIISLFPGVQLSISMVTKPPVSEASDIKRNITSKNQHPDTNILTSSYVNYLTIQLHRMLLAYHLSAWPNLASLPQPATGPVQVPSSYRCAGALAMPLSHFSPSVTDPISNAGFSIAVAAVAGFANPAASAWLATNFSNKADPAGIQRAHPVTMGQDRLSLFSEWGSVQNCPGGPNIASNVGLRSNPLDNSIPGTSNVALMDHVLFGRGADTGALKSVIGSGHTMLNQVTAMCRHYYLRQTTYNILSRFARHSSVRVVVHWDAMNSAFQTSARICFYAADYDAYQSWLGLTIGSKGLTVFYSNTPRSYHLGTDFKRLNEILANQCIHTQIHFLDFLAIKILGWTRLGNNPFSGLANPHEAGDGPIVVKMFSSPSGKNIICLRASVSAGIRLFVSRSPKSAQTDTISLDDSPPNFREVRLSAVHGKHAVAKVEAIMTLLS